MGRDGHGPHLSVGPFPVNDSLNSLKRLQVKTTCHVQSRRTGLPAEDAAGVWTLDDGLVLAALADGIGGAARGGEAAHSAVSVFSSNFRARPRAWTTAKSLDEIFRHLNRQLFNEGMAKFASSQHACTFAGVVLDGAKLHGVNAGDSRVYRLRGGQVERLSVDHREPLPEGRFKLTLALGLEEAIQPHRFDGDLQAGDRFLLCSDGVSDVLDDEELQKLLQDQAVARSIIATVAAKLDGREGDDLSAVTLDVVETGEGSRAAELPIPDQLKAGQVVDGFTLRQSFRASNRTWLAVRGGKPFVLKFPPAEARTNEALLHHFILEQWHATQLRAPFFPEAFIPDNATLRFYALEYVPAPTLRQWLDRGQRLTPQQAVVLGRFLLQAGQFLLGRGFVHADLKPENILVDGDGAELAFKLIDLGNVAEVFSVNTRAGTPSYLAPERFKGAAICEGTELFSIGVILYQALTGHLPFGEIEPFQAPAFRRPKSVTTYEPLCPAWLDAVIQHAIATDTATRYAAYSEAIFDLDKPEQVRPATDPSRPLLERNPLLFYKVGFCLMTLVALVLLILLLRSQEVLR